MSIKLQMALAKMKANIMTHQNVFITDSYDISLLTNTISNQIYDYY